MPTDSLRMARIHPGHNGPPPLSNVIPEPAQNRVNLDPETPEQERLRSSFFGLWLFLIFLNVFLLINDIWAPLSYKNFSLVGLPCNLTSTIGLAIASLPPKRQVIVIAKADRTRAHIFLALVRKEWGFLTHCGCLSNPQCQFGLTELERQPQQLPQHCCCPFPRWHFAF